MIRKHLNQLPPERHIVNGRTYSHHWDPSRFNAIERFSNRAGDVWGALVIGSLVVFTVIHLVRWLAD